MKIEDILKKQGELYKNLPEDKIIQERSETVEQMASYKNYRISKREYKAIKGLEKLLGKEPRITDIPSSVDDIFSDYNFEISMRNSQIIYLRINRLNLKQIPKQINNLTNLQRLFLSYNKISKIENLDNLQNLKILWLEYNPIENMKEVKNLKKKRIYVDI